MQNNRLEHTKTAIIENLCFYRAKDYQRKKNLSPKHDAITCVCVRTYAYMHRQRASNYPDYPSLPPTP